MVTHNTSLPKQGVPSDQQIDHWLDRLAKQRDDGEIKRLRHAITLARKAHRDEQYPDGMDLLLALLHAADTLDQLKLDSDTLIAAILSEMPDEADYAPQFLRQAFGDSVVDMLEQVAAIRELSAISSQSDDGKDIENLRRMLLGIAHDVRSVLVLLGKRLRLMRHLKQLPEELRRRIASETHLVHAPLANRLGVWHIKWELEDLSLRYLEPEQYQSLARQLDGKRHEREAFIAGVIAVLREDCKSNGITADITGRPKHIYSIWKKMQRKRVNFEQVFDVRAVRVLVETIPQCYEVLGLVHGRWRPVPGEFDDYIAHPKPNGYSSLHTAVVGDDGVPLEVQIRTREMHEHAERGVAAHWRYKESSQQDHELERRIEWMRRFLEQADDMGGGQLALDAEDTEFEAKRIYLLSPQGKVVELPRGATAIDFAYAIHTSVGHRCRGAKVNGRIVSLTQPLESGQQIEILTAKHEAPSRDWLNPHSGYLVTSRARERVRHWFKHQDFDHHVATGRASLDREVTRLAVPRPDLDKLASRFHFKNADDLLAAIGQGEVSAIQVANAQAESLKVDQDQLAEEQIPERVRQRAPHRNSASGQVIVHGVDDLLTHMAKCCKPVPYDPIIGYITRGRGVTVHRRDCSVVKKMDDENQARLIDVVWADIQKDSRFIVDIQIVAGDRKGLLRDISSIFANVEIDVLGVSTHTDRRKDRAGMRFTVEVEDMDQLSRVIERLAQIPDVLDVRRQI